MQFSNRRNFCKRNFIKIIMFAYIKNVMVNLIKDIA